MRIWGTLYKYELKKIIRKRFTIVSLIFIYAFIILAIFSEHIGNKSYYGFYEIPRSDYITLVINNNRALSGHALDEELISKTIAADMARRDLYIDDSSSEAERLQAAETELQGFLPYLSAFDYMMNVLKVSGYEQFIRNPSEKEFYAMEFKNLKAKFDALNLNKKEKEYWLQKYESFQRPTVLRYHEAYGTVLNAVYALAVFMIMLSGISLSGIFSEDRLLKCDSIILSSRHGKGMLYSAKIAAGVTFAEISAAGLYIVIFAAYCIIYGMEGFMAPLRLYRPFYPYDISIGQFAFVAFGCMLAVVFFMSLFTMLLSVCFSRPVIPMSIITVSIFTGMFANIPDSFRIASQIWDWLPVNYLFASNLYDLRLFPFFGRYLVSWQILPFLYAAAGVVIIITAKKIYRK